MSDDKVLVLCGAVVLLAFFAACLGAMCGHYGRLCTSLLESLSKHGDELEAAHRETAEADARLRRERRAWLEATTREFKGGLVSRDVQFQCLLDNTLHPTRDDAEDHALGVVDARSEETGV